MIETNPEIIEKIEKKLRNKYGVLMLTSALLSTTFGLFGFIASIMGAAQYEDAALAGLISVLLITDAILASICVITSGAFRKSTKPKKVSKKVQNATKGFLVVGGIVMALEGNVSGEKQQKNTIRYIKLQERMAVRRIMHSQNGKTQRRQPPP